MSQSTAQRIKASLKREQRLVLYDAKCGLCARSKKLITALDSFNALIWVSMEIDELDKYFNNLPSLEQRRGAITVWKPPSKVNQGPLAMADIYEVLPVPICWLSTLLRWPLIQPLTWSVYNFISANRHRWLPPLDDGENISHDRCKL